jgi:hypothetical protein
VKKYVVLLLLSLIIAPVTVSAANYLLGDRRGNWQTPTVPVPGFCLTHQNIRTRSFAGLLHGRYAGAVSSRVHTWIVVKERGASRYSRYDYTA